MLNQTITISPEVLFQEFNEECVILDLKSSSYFGLDAVGARLWQLLTDNPSLEDAVQVLTDEYDVESDRLEQDVIELVEQLRLAGLIDVQ